MAKLHSNSRTRCLKLSIALFFAAVLALLLVPPNPVEGQSAAAQEAPATDLNILTDDLFNGFGNRSAPIDECKGEPVPNRSFEDNKKTVNKSFVGSV